ncbi:MAG: glycosyltransferase family 2 protein, partial [Nitrospirae bacterium]
MLTRRAPITSHEDPYRAQPRSHISVCVCTYKRPAMLATLLHALRLQDTGGAFTYSVVVVDNDHTASAEETVRELLRHSSPPMSYHVEPEQ